MTKRTAGLAAPPERDPEAVILPRNIDAERAVLGSCLLHAQSADYVVDHVVTEDFFRRSHQTVFEAVRQLRQRGVGVDLIPLCEELDRRKSMEEIGGKSYLMSLIDGLPQKANLPHYVAILKDLHAKRALYHFARQTIDLVGDDAHGADAILADVDQRLLSLRAGHVDGRMESLATSTKTLLDDLEWKVAHKGELLGLTSGFKSVDDMMLGWQAGDLTVLGARPSVGKTTWAVNASVAGARALQAAGSGAAVAIFSFEMRRKQLEYRILSGLSGVPLSRLLSGYIAQTEYGRLSEAIAQMGDLPIEIDDQAGQTRWQIRSTCRRLKATRGLALIVIDYVQLIPGSLERRGASRNEEIADISRGLKELSDEVQAPILLLSQLSRANDKRPDPRPKMSDLRDSGALEQDADNIVFLHRKDHREGGTTEFLLAKQRNGPTGSGYVTLDRDIVTFTDGGEPPAPEPKATPAPGYKARKPEKAKPAPETRVYD